MCDRLPSYEESRQDAEKWREKAQQYNFAEGVTVSRAQRVAAAASKIQEVLETRARHGISKSTILLVPRGQLGT